MARMTSIEKGGFYPFPTEYLPAVASLFAPADSSAKSESWRLLDPCAGEGEALEHLASAWKLTPYANELAPQRARACQERFGPLRAVEGDLYQLRAPTGGFVLGWINPPYVWDTSAGERRELHMLRHSVKWIQTGGYALWVVYQHHVTPKAAEFLAKYSDQVDIWRTPDLHLGTYTHVVVVARMGRPKKSLVAFTQEILDKAANPHVLVPQPGPLYQLPAPRKLRRFYFAPKVLTPELVVAAARQEGAQLISRFQAVIAPEAEQEQIQPLAQPSNGQLALILAAGLFNGIIIHKEDGTRLALRGKVEQREELEESTSTGEGEASVDTETYRTRPRTTITTLDAGGQVTLVDNDEGVVDLIQSYKDQLLAYMEEHFAPRYTFQPGPAIVPVLNAIRVKGRHALWETQKHVIAAAYEGFKHRKGLFIVGEPGIGKTPIGVALALLMQRQAQRGQVCLVTAPPHLTPKWEREARQICTRLGQKVHIAIVRRVEEVTAFIRQAESLQAGMLKLMIIPREMTKLSEGWEAAVVWRKQHIAQWKADGIRPSYLPAGSERIVSLERPHCPTCGAVVTRVENGQHVAASKAFLNRTQHYCPACGGAVWQQKRTFSAPKKGQKYPAKNPRYPLADFIAQRYPDRILFYASDEIHELKSTATGQGLAMQRLAGVARYTAGLTGTLYGGTASSLYGLEFTMNPRVRALYPWAQQGMARWVKRMGVMEREVEYKPDYDEHGRYTGKRVVEKKPAEAPGCSPELVQEIIDHVIMVGLLDSGREMPDFEEIPVPIPMDSDMQTYYDSTQQDLGKYLFQCAMEGDASFMGAYLQGLLSWPTAAFREERFIHRKKLVYTDERGEEVTEIMPHEVATLLGLGTDRVYPKEQWLLELLDAELSQNRRVAVYCRQTGTRDIQRRLEELIREHVPLARPWVMYGDRIAAEKREERLEREVKNGVNVLICNPILVQTGLDLVDFPTIVFYEVNYSLFVMGQAARRAWRIIQDQPCRVFYPYYEACMEERAVTLVGRKQAAANLLAGQGTGEGLSAFTGGLGGSDGLLSALADNFNDADKAASSQIFGKVDTTIDRAASTWLSGIDANPEAFVLPGGTVDSITVPVERTAAAPQVQPEPEEEASVLAPPEKVFRSETPQPRRVSRADLDRAPGDEEAISVPDWPQRERKEQQQEREPEIVQLALF